MSDTGHDNLIADLRQLLAKAEAFEFHDFKNTTFATPKIALDEILRGLASKVRKGDYDNRL